MSFSEFGFGPVQFAGDGFKLPVVNAKLAQVFNCVAHIVFASAKLALSLPNKFEDILVVQLTRILGVGAVDDKGEGLSGATARQMHRFHNFDIDIGNLFPLAEVVERFRPVRTVHLKGHAPARAATVEAKDEPWLQWCTAVLMRVDAETAMEAAQCGDVAAQIWEARVPHQGTVTKHPRVRLPRHQLFPA